MSRKPHVFKMGGSWIWQCNHSAERRFGDAFMLSAWRNAWDACLSQALDHHANHHAEVEVIDL